MEVKKPTHRYQSYYEDVCLGVQKLRQTGGCTVITIPKAVMSKLRLRKNSHVMVTLHIRRKKFHDELEEGKEWVKISRRERIMFQEWLDKRKKDMEKTIDWDM